jgi:hypothetical protein
MKKTFCNLSSCLFAIFICLTFIHLPLQAQQANDKEYTDKILEYTTENFFLTDLVDHLPASDTVPTPQKILGHVIGVPDILHYTAEIEKYMKAIADVSPRVVAFSLGKTDEGKEMITVVVSDEENIGRLEQIKETTGLLADPRKVDEQKLDNLLDQGRPIYWLTGALHSSESGSPEMLMELVYRLAVDESEVFQTIRKNLVVMITPVLEVDGRDRYVDTYMYKKEHKDKMSIPLVYWGNYVGHDNNRDTLGLALKLTENTLQAYFEWHPIIMHDLHESVPYLYTSTGTGPYNAWLDPITIDEWQELAYAEISEMTKRGVPGVWTHGFFDGWSPSYLFYVALYHNSTGRFYETFGGTGADTLVRTVGSQSERAWYRPNPPLKAVKWSIRNNINLQQSGVLFALKHVADNSRKFLHNFYLKSKRSVAKATTEGPAAWIIPADGKRPLAAAALVNLLRKHGVEIHRANQPFEAEKEKYPAGTYIIRMDQPYSRCADMLLDTQYYNPDDPRPYDDTGWTLGALHNVETHRIVEPEILDVEMDLLAADVKIPGQVVNAKKAKAFLVNHRAENVLMKFRYDLEDIKMLAAERSFKIKETDFNAGTFILPVDGNPTDLQDRLEQKTAELGLTAWGISELPDVPAHELAVPRIAILHTWIFTQNEGWFRLAFEKLGIPYHYLSIHDIRDTEELKSKYDVIIFPPVMFGKVQRLVNGISGDSAIPWKKMEKYIHLGGPDSRDDIRGGMGLPGILNLYRFIQNGGVFIPITTNASLPIDYGMVESVALAKTEKLKATGSVLQARITDNRSPITYGYGRTLGVYFNGGPVLDAGMKAATGGIDLADLMDGAAKGRASGRGGTDDPDVIQGRPRTPPKVKGAGTGIPAEFKDLINLYMPPDLTTLRVILRFDQKEKLLISGMLEGGEELQNQAAVIDVPVGKGHVLFFSFNPMWRFETHGSFFLLFNAALNYDNLDAGRPKPAAKK